MCFLGLPPPTPAPTIPPPPRPVAKLLLRLKQQQRLVLTPAQDYDDSYTIEYAKRNPGSVIVTNDRFRDHVDKHSGNRRELRAWLTAHCMTFTFVMDDFLPNPDFVFPDR